MKTVVAVAAVAARKTALGFKQRLLQFQTKLHFGAAGEPLGRGQARLGGPGLRRVVEGGDIVERDHRLSRCIDGVVQSLQHTVNLVRRALAHADRLGDEARHAGQVAAGPDALGAGGLGRIDLQQRTVYREVLGQRRQLGVLSDRADDGVGGQHELAAIHRRDAELAALGAGLEADVHARQRKAGAALRRDLGEHRAIDERDAFFKRLGQLLGLRRHLLGALECEQRHRVAGAPRAARRVERRTAATHDDQTRSQRGRRARVGTRQIVGAVHPPLGCLGQLRQALGPARADGQIDRVVRGAQVLDILMARHRVAALEFDAERVQSVQLAIEHRSSEPVGRNAIAHQAAKLGLRLKHGDAVAAPAQLERRRQARRAGADDGHMRVALDFGGGKSPAGNERHVADQPLQFADRQRRVETGAVAARFARVVADAPGHGREGVVARQHLPGATEIARPRQRDPLGDVAAHRTRLVAGRWRGDVVRQRGAPGAGLEALGAAGGPDRRWQLLCLHAAALCNCASTAR